MIKLIFYNTKEINFTTSLRFPLAEHSLYQWYLVSSLGIHMLVSYQLRYCAVGSQHFKHVLEAKDINAASVYIHMANMPVMLSEEIPTDINELLDITGIV